MLTPVLKRNASRKQSLALELEIDELSSGHKEVKKWPAPQYNLTNQPKIWVDQCHPSPGQYTPVYPSASQYNPTNHLMTLADQCHPSPRQYTPVHPSTPQCNLVHPSTTQYTPLQPYQPTHDMSWPMSVLLTMPIQVLHWRRKSPHVE